MSVSVVNKGNLNDDQEEVLERFIEFQYAMIEKNFFIVLLALHLRKYNKFDRFYLPLRDI